MSGSNGDWSRDLSRRDRYGTSGGLSRRDSSDDASIRSDSGSVPTPCPDTSTKRPAARSVVVQGAIPAATPNGPHRELSLPVKAHRLRALRGGRSASNRSGAVGGTTSLIVREELGDGCGVLSDTRPSPNWRSRWDAEAARPKRCRDTGRCARRAPGLSSAPAGEWGMVSSVKTDRPNGWPTDWGSCRCSHGAELVAGDEVGECAEGKRAAPVCAIASTRWCRFLLCRGLQGMVPDSSMRPCWRWEPRPARRPRGCVGRAGERSKGLSGPSGQHLVATGRGRRKRMTGVGIAGGKGRWVWSSVVSSRWGAAAESGGR